MRAIPNPCSPPPFPSHTRWSRCLTEEDYTEALMRVLRMDQLERMTMAAAARRRARRFSDARFKAAFLAALEPCLPA